MVLKTGDVVFSSGHGTFSKIIKEVTGCKWSHLAIVASEGKVIEAVGDGVRIGLLTDQRDSQRDFLTRTVNPGSGDVAVRQVHWPDANVYAGAVMAFWRFAKKVVGEPYEQHHKQLFEAAFPFLRCSDEDLKSLFCWECAAATWKAMGLLPPDRPSHTYQPSDFEAMTTLYNGATLGPLTHLSDCDF